MAGRQGFPIYRIETDDFSGQLKVRLSFAPHPAAITRRTDEATGLVAADVMDGGLAGTLTAPAGSRLGETADGTPVLVLADGTTLGASEAVRSARVTDRSKSFGLGWSPARDDD